MCLYLSHRGAFIHGPLKCWAVLCSWNVRHVAWAACTYGRLWYLPQGWLSDLPEDLNILWARENWSCQWSRAFTACLIPCLWYRHVFPSLSMSEDAPAIRWKRTEMTPTLSHQRDWEETKWERCNATFIALLKIDHYLANKTKASSRERNMSLGELWSLESVR